LLLVLIEAKMCRSVEFTDDIVLMATDSVGDGKIRSLFGVHASHWRRVSARNSSRRFSQEIDDKLDSMIQKQGFTDSAPIVGDGS